MKPKKLEFDKIYDKDKLTNAYIIQVTLDSYNDIFNDFDPAPFKKRDIDPDLKEFLENCSSDIPLKFPIKIQFLVPQRSSQEDRIITGLRTYFSFYRYSLGKEYNSTVRKNIFSGVLAFLFLFFTFLLSSYNVNEIFFQLLIEGLYIGGWVCLWQAISSFAFDSHDLKSNYETYRRFSNTDIQFIERLENPIIIEQIE